VVSGEAGRGLVDFVEEAQGPGDAGWVGLLEVDGDRVGGVGDDPGQAADDRLAGDRAVFVVVAQVGLPRIFRTVELMLLMLGAGRSDTRRGPLAVSGSRVETRPIIPELDIPRNILSGLLPRRVNGPVDPLDVTSQTPC
jgi:hypothetical protein